MLGVGFFNRPKPRITRMFTNFLGVALRGLDTLPTGQGLSQLIIDNGEWIIVFSVDWMPPLGHSEAFCGGLFIAVAFIVGQVLLDWFFSYMLLIEL